MERLRTRQLQQIIDLSRQMLDRAQAMEWEQVAELEGQRKHLVTSCFRQPTAEQDAPEVGAAIREILSLNQQISTLGRECQAHLSGEIHAHTVGRNAATAYLSHARR